MERFYIRNYYLTEYTSNKLFEQVKNVNKDITKEELQSLIMDLAILKEGDETIPAYYAVRYFILLYGKKFILFPDENGKIAEVKLNMRNPERIDRILNLIREIWNQQPDTRFLQLVDNLTWEFSKRNNNKLHETVYNKHELSDGVAFTRKVVVNGFHVEDSEFEKFLKDYLNELESDGGVITYRSTGNLKKKYGI
jgi:uncharacterized protein YihD (DUF1040 family)